MPDWLKIIEGEPIPETEEYGVTSYVYRARQPFIPEKLSQVLNGDLPGVIRAKGHFWLATQPDFVAEFSLAGSRSSVTAIGQWWATMPKEQLPDNENVRAYLKERWGEPWGDRRQEIVFIGADIDWPALKARLDSCLVPVMTATSVEALPDYNDPFPKWQLRERVA